jgi:hypothetical protein
VPVFTLLLHFDWCVLHLYIFSPVLSLPQRLNQEVQPLPSRNSHIIDLLQPLACLVEESQGLPDDDVSFVDFEGESSSEARDVFGRYGSANGETVLLLRSVLV